MVLSKERPTEEYGKIVPNGELECLWVSAGVVPYKLCDLHYDCDHCAFNQVMHGGDEVIPARLNIKGYKLCSALFYHACHTWATIEENGNVRIGIDDFAQNLLGQIQDVLLPGEGSWLQGKSIWVKAHDMMIPLTSPVEGPIVGVNSLLHSYPLLLNKDPYASGWIVSIRPVNLLKSIGQLYYGASAQQWYEKEIGRFSSLLAIENGLCQSEVGETLQDGGSLADDLLGKMEKKEIHKILKQFFFK